MPNKITDYINEIFPRTTIDGKLKAIRNERDRLLTESDWTQLSDAALTFDERAMWQTYRQSLRDIPQNYANPDDVIFPETP